MQTLPVCWVPCLLGAPVEYCANWIRGGGRGAVAKRRVGKEKIAQGKSSRGRMQSKHLPGHLRSGILPFSQMLNSKIGFHSGFEGDNYP